MTEELQAKIKLLPLDPGVYVMLDAYNNIIYVGKAKRLKNRVTQYFRNGFKTEKVAQSYLAAALNAPVTVMKTAGEGGAWGIAVLANYLINKNGKTLEEYLENDVFADMEGVNTVMFTFL